MGEWVNAIRHSIARIAKKLNVRSRKLRLFLAVTALILAASALVDYPYPLMGLAVIIALPLISSASLGLVGRIRQRTSRVPQVRESQDANDAVETSAPLLRELVHIETKVAIFAPIDLNVIDGSSIWLRNTISLFSESHQTVVILHKDIKFSPVTESLILMLAKSNISVVSPADLKWRQIDADNVTRVFETLDNFLPHLTQVVVRGLETGRELVNSRRFYSRLAVYLTDFYTLSPEGRPYVSSQAQQDVLVLASRGVTFVCQTELIRQEIAQLVPGFDPQFLTLPPLVLSPMVKRSRAIGRPEGDELRIAYLGKVSALWGLTELSLLFKQLRFSGVDFSGHLFIGKISRGAEEFLSDLAHMPEVQIMSSVDHQRGLAHLAKADIAYCWRPPKLEEHSLELSSKLVEAAALGVPVLAYPNQQNVDLLGEKYPGLVREPSDFMTAIAALMGTERVFFEELASSIQTRHGRPAGTMVVRELLGRECRQSTESDYSVIVAGHDLKFVDAFASSLKADGSSVTFESWGWNEPPVNKPQPIGPGTSIFCEWGLGNAVYHSANLPPGAKLLVRVHLQEIKGARRIASKINPENVSRFIFVSEMVRNEAIQMFGWELEKTVVIPNYVLDQCLPLQERTLTGRLRLGLLGMVPERKRLDRAIDLCEAFLDRGIDAELHVKSVDPLSWHGRRESEIKYFENQFKRVIDHPLLSTRVFFEPFGPDVYEWYSGVDFILSPSDFESFHYAVADGVCTGAFPVIWPWTSAVDIYPSNWVVKDTDDALERIMEIHSTSRMARYLLAGENRRFIVDRYGFRAVSGQLLQELSGRSD